MCRSAVPGHARHDHPGLGLPIAPARTGLAAAAARIVIGTLSRAALPASAREAGADCPGNDSTACILPPRPSRADAHGTVVRSGWIGSVGGVKVWKVAPSRSSREAIGE